MYSVQYDIFIEMYCTARALTKSESVVVTYTYIVNQILSWIQYFLVVLHKDYSSNIAPDFSPKYDVNASNAPIIGFNWLFHHSFPRKEIFAKKNLKIWGLTLLNSLDFQPTLQERKNCLFLISLIKMQTQQARFWYFLSQKNLIWYRTPWWNLVFIWRSSVMDLFYHFLSL